MAVRFSYHWDPYSPQFFAVVSSAASVNESDAPESMHSAWTANLKSFLQLPGAEVDAAMRRLSMSELLALLAGLTDSPQVVLDLMYRERGRVLLEIVSICGCHAARPLLESIAADFLSIATDQNGCHAVQSLLEVVDFASPLWQLLSRHFPVLLMHPYGNFVVKHAISLSNHVINTAFVSQLTSQARLLKAACVNKHGSHVVEQLFKFAPFPSCHELCRAIFGDWRLLQVLTQNSIGNYVVQSALHMLTADHPDHLGLRKWVTCEIEPFLSTSSHRVNLMRCIAALSAPELASIKRRSVPRVS